MKILGKWLLLGLAISSLVLGGGLFALQRWIRTDDFRLRVEARASKALGKPVTLARLDVDLWPLPAIALSNVSVQTRPAMFLERIEVRPVLGSLVSGRVELATLLVRRAVLAQAAIDDLLPGASTTSSSRTAAPGSSGAVTLVPRRVVFDTVTWRSRQGEVTTLDADARLDAQGFPDALDMWVLAGRLQGARMRLTRKQQVWDVAVDVAGGKITGELALRGGSPNAVAVALDGQLHTRNVDLGVLLRRPARDGSAGPGQSPMRGKIEAVTHIHAKASSLAAILGELRSDSRFTVRDAVVVGVDLSRAVKSVGWSRGGETRLDTLGGRVVTQGQAIELRDLVAISGALRASGNVAIAPSRSLSGKVEVDLGAKAVGVPLAVGGTLDAPQLSLTRSAMVGAAVGSLLMPGAGTAAGVTLGEKVGDKLQKLFGK